MKSLLAFLLASSVFAAEPKVIPLWPGAAPGSESWDWNEAETTSPNDTFRRITNVTHPTMLAFLPPADLANGTAVVVCPGGGFRLLAYHHEGLQVAEWLNSLGIAAFVVKYRVMRTGDPGEKDPAVMAARRKEVIPMALADVQQAIKLVRAHAAEWKIDRNRVGVMGFSAGGYVTADVAMHHDAESRPDFAAPIYPGTPSELAVPADAPPLFLAHADDDRTVAPLDHSIRLYAAWKKAGLPAELHIYRRGGHGFGMRKTGLPSATWIDRFADWLTDLSFLKKGK